MADVVVYGGELAGVAAALCAARRAGDGAEVVLIFPEGAPGGIATVGGLCGWEHRYWTHGGRRDLPQAGSFATWFSETGPIYSPGAFAAALSEELADAGVRVLAGYELEAVLPAGSAGGRGGRSRKPRPGPFAGIAAVRVRPLAQEGPGPVLAGEPEEIPGRIFIDGSATGRLARLAQVPLSLGRSDWNPDARQMVASLLFAVENVDMGALAAAHDAADKPLWGTAALDTPAGTRRTFWGGAPIAAGDSVLAAFAAANPGFRIGAPRAWEESPGVFWVSALHVYNVDGRRRAYDATTDPETLPSTRDIDTAYAEARALVGSSDLLGSLRRFPGLDEVRLVETAGAVRCGEVLCLRETVHAVGPAAQGFSVRVEDVTGAGAHAHEGMDARHHARRIGLGFHWLENAGYTHGEVLRTTAAAANPTYLPLDCVLVPPVTNLLVPGYAARMESRAWWALRAAPNLCVLGDAAGTAAAFALHEGVDVLHFGHPEMAAVQSWLTTDGARLDKW